MTRINLLPEDLRTKEDKELAKISKKPKVFEMELSRPVDDRANLNSDKPKKSLWQRIFGTRSKPKKQESLPPLVKPAMPSSQVNFASRANRQKIVRQSNIHKVKRPKQKKAPFFSGIFGKPQFPIKAGDQRLASQSKMSSPKNTKDFTPSSREIVSERYAADKLQKTTVPAFKPKRRGFWLWFTGLFGRHSKRDSIAELREEQQRILNSSTKLDKREDGKRKHKEDRIKHRKGAKSGFFKRFLSLFSFRKKKRVPKIAGEEKSQKLLSSSFDLSGASRELKKEMKKRQKEQKKKDKAEKHRKAGWLKKLFSWFSFKKRSAKKAPSLSADIVKERQLKEAKDHDVKSPDFSGGEKKSFWLRRRQKKAEKAKVKLEKKRKQEEKDELREQEKNNGKYHLAPKVERLGLDINLMPQEIISIKYYSFGWKIFVLLVVVVLSAAILTGSSFWLDLKRQSIEDEFTAKNKELASLIGEVSSYRQQYEQRRSIQSKLILIKGIIDDHIHWSQFLNLLEAYTLEGVYYTDLDVDVTGEFVLPTVAKNYHVLAEQIFVLERAPDLIKTVKADNIKIFMGSRGGVRGVSCDLKIVLIDDFFNK